MTMTRRVTSVILIGVMCQIHGQFGKVSIASPVEEINVAVPAKTIYLVDSRGTQYLQAQSVTNEVLVQTGNNQSVVQPGTSDNMVQPGTNEIVVQPGTKDIVVQLGTNDISLQPEISDGVLPPGTGDILGKQATSDTVVQPGTSDIVAEPGTNDLGAQWNANDPLTIHTDMHLPIDSLIILGSPVEIVRDVSIPVEHRQTLPRHTVLSLDHATSVSKEVIMRLLDAGTSDIDTNKQEDFGMREANHEQPLMPPIVAATVDLSFPPLPRQIHDFPVIISEVPFIEGAHINTVLRLHPKTPIVPNFPLPKMRQTWFPKFPPPVMPKTFLPKIPLPSIPMHVLPQFPIIPKTVLPKIPLPPKPKPALHKIPPPQLPQILSPEFTPPIMPTIGLPKLPPPLPDINIHIRKKLNVQKVHQTKNVPFASKDVGITKLPVNFGNIIKVDHTNPIVKLPVKNILSPNTLPLKLKQQNNVIKKTSKSTAVPRAKQVISKSPNLSVIGVVQNKKKSSVTEINGVKTKNNFAAVQTTLDALDRFHGISQTSTDESLDLSLGNRTSPNIPAVEFLGGHPQWQFTRKKGSGRMSGMVGPFTPTVSDLPHGFGNENPAFDLDIRLESMANTSSFIGNNQQRQHLVDRLISKDLFNNNQGYGTLQSDVTVKATVDERVMRDMDLTVDPCNNFYRFACGGYIRNSEITNGVMSKGNEAANKVMEVVKTAMDELTTSSEPGPLTKAKVLYNSCMDESSIEAKGFTEIYKFMSELGGWPVLGNWDDYNFDFVELLAKPRQYIKDYGFHYEPTGIIIGTVIQRDFRVAGRYGLYIDQPSLGQTSFGGLPNLELYLFGKKSVHIEAYKQYATDIAVALGADPVTARREMRAIVYFEKSLARIMLREEERRLVEMRYNRLSIIDLTMRYPKFEWLRYFQTIVQQSNANILVEPTDPVILWAQPYYDRLFHLLRKVSHRTLANYVVWRALQPLLPAMGRGIQRITARYVAVINGASQIALPPRRDFCAQVVIDNMRWVASRVYVDRAFGPEALAKVLEIAEYVKRAYIENIQRTDWLDDSTKSALLMKIRTLKDDFAFPEFLTNNKYLADFYQDHHLTLDNFFENMKRAYTQNYARTLQQLAYPQLARWILSPVEVNALHNPGSNAIELPAAIIQEPFFSLDYPLAMNVGGIGWLIGHEYGHGYDVTGAKFDNNGMINKVWSDASFQNFARRADCFVRQFSDYYLPEGDLRIRNGNKTLNENLCDFIGHRAALFAYRRMTADGVTGRDHHVAQFTGDQLYFINSARLLCSRMTPRFLRKVPYLAHHSVDRLRVIGTLQNLPEFSAAFSCPRGSPMNPGRKCDFW